MISSVTMRSYSRLLGVSVVFCALGCASRQKVALDFELSDSEAVTCSKELDRVIGYRNTFVKDATEKFRSEEALLQCRSEDRRRIKAAARAVEEARRQEERNREAAEIQRERAEQTRAAEDREVVYRDLSLEPKHVQIGWSALLCSLAKKKAEAKAEVAEERKYAAEGGGIVDMRNLYSQQVTMRAVDKVSAIAQVAIREARRRPLPCTKDVARIAACFHDARDARECDAVYAAFYWRIVNDAVEARLRPEPVMPAVGR